VRNVESSLEINREIDKEKISEFMIKTSFHSNFITDLLYKKFELGRRFLYIAKWDEENNDMPKFSNLKIPINLDDKISNFFFRMLPFISIIISVIIFISSGLNRVIFGVNLLFISFSIIVYLMHYYSSGSYYIRENIKNLKQQIEIGHYRGVPVIIKANSMSCSKNSFNSDEVLVSDGETSIPIRYNLYNSFWNNSCPVKEGLEEFYIIGFFRRELTPIIEVNKIVGNCGELYKFSCKTKFNVLIAVLLISGVVLILSELV
jgi:hypothetical protein